MGSYQSTPVTTSWARFLYGGFSLQSRSQLQMYEATQPCMLILRNPSTLWESYPRSSSFVVLQSLHNLRRNYS